MCHLAIHSEVMIIKKKLPMLMYLYLNPTRVFVFKYTSVYLTPCLAITASGERDVKNHVYTYGRGEHLRILLEMGTATTVLYKILSSTLLL